MGFFSDFSNKSRSAYLNHMLYERAIALHNECCRRELGGDVAQACSALLRSADRDLRNLALKKQISAVESMLGRAELDRNKDLVGSAAVFTLGIWLEALARAKAYPEWAMDYLPTADNAEQHLLHVVGLGGEEWGLVNRLFDLVAPLDLVNARAAGRRQAERDEQKRLQVGPAQGHLGPEDDIPF